MNAELIEKIEQHLDGQLSREALAAIAQQAGVQDLDEAIQWVQDSQIAIEMAGLRDQLKVALPQAGGAKVRNLRPLRLALAAAASVLVLVMAYFFVFQEQEPSLYAEYEFVDPGLPVLMSQSEQHQLYDALSYYSEGDYTTAAEKLQLLPSSYQQNDTVLYYLGASQLYLGATTSAAANLQKVRAQKDSPFQAQAEWLLVLASLRAEKYDQAKALLPAILENPSHPFFEQAQTLNQDLHN